MKKKIFDCFNYYDEDILLDLRFNILDPVVDFFVIAEAKQDYRGKLKNLNFKKEKFRKFESKIIYLVVNEFPKKIDSWGRQAYQRNYLANGIEKSSPDDLIIYSDVDEIPNPNKILDLEINKYGIFLQKCFYYKLNLINSKIGITWEGSRVCNKRNLISFEKMRNEIKVKYLNYPFWRVDKEKQIKLIHSGGWHFSYLMNAQKIRQKIKTFAHTELDKPEFTNLNSIENSITQKIDLFGRSEYSGMLEKVILDSNFPNYLLENQQQYKEWII